ALPRVVRLLRRARARGAGRGAARGDALPHGRGVGARAGAGGGGGPAVSGPAAGARDYRSSHLGEGAGYHERFERHAWRAILWELEREILLDVLARRVPQPRSAPLLDFACGTGRILALLEPHVGEAVGVDVSPSMLAVAEQQVRRATLLRCDLTREPALEGRRFDLITAFRFFPNAEPALRHEAMERLCGLLAPGGLLI